MDMDGMRQENARLRAALVDLYRATGSITARDLRSETAVRLTLAMFKAQLALEQKAEEAA
jgi:hypothetical protein